MKHDRSILNAKGGPWATIADAVRAQTEAIIKTGRPLNKPALPAECDELAKRREALGMTMKEFARAAKLHKSMVYKVEVGTSGTEALRRQPADGRQIPALSSDRSSRSIGAQGAWEQAGSAYVAATIVGTGQRLLASR
jgi:DNA-binding transcriptional regulator YiaG